MIFPSSHDFHGHLTGMATSGWTAPGGPREGGRILGDVGPEGATHGALDQRVAEHQKSGNLGPKMGPKSVDFRGKMNEIEHEHDKPWDLGVILCYIYVYIYDVILPFWHTHLGHFTSRWHRASCCTAFDWIDLECASSSVQASTDSTCWHRLLVQYSPRTMSEIWFQGKLSGNPYSWWGNYMKLWFLDL